MQKARYASARSAGLGVPTSTNDFCILLPHNIEFIDKVEMLNPTTNVYNRWVASGSSMTAGTGGLVYDDDVVLDISSFVFDSSIYGLLCSQYSISGFATERTTLNDIDLSNSFGSTNSARALTAKIAA